MKDDQDDLFDDLTPVQRRRLKSSIDIHDTPAERIAYQHTVLCQTCLPYRDPGAATRIWERQQGGLSRRRGGARSRSEDAEVRRGGAALRLPAAADPCPPEPRSAAARVAANRGREQQARRVI
jgi:hypothetical protein